MAKRTQKTGGGEATTAPAASLEVDDAAAFTPWAQWARGYSGAAPATAEGQRLERFAQLLVRAARGNGTVDDFARIAATAKLYAETRPQDAGPLNALAQYASARADVERGRVVDATRATRAASQEPEWIQEPDSWWARHGRKLVLGVGAVFVVGLMLLGLRSIFWAPAATSTYQPPVGSDFPAVPSSGVAERFTENYLTWTTGESDVRAELLQVDLASNVDAAASGWDGNGRQTADSATVVRIDVVDDTRATLTVQVRVTVYSWDGNGWIDPTVSWQALSVPIEIVDGRPVVAATPALTGASAPGAATQTSSPTADSGLTSATRADAESFFAAYASGTGLASLSAPGAELTGLAGAYEFVSLRDWVVYPGDGDTRQAVALVRMTVPQTVNADPESNPATIDQAYSVTLTLVTAGSVERWQVSAITAQ